MRLCNHRPPNGLQRTALSAAMYMIACFACVLVSRVGWVPAEVSLGASYQGATIHALFYIGIFVFAEASFILMAITGVLTGSPQAIGRGLNCGIIGKCRPASACT
jgi:hypothetical protein